MLRPDAQIARKPRGTERIDTRQVDFPRREELPARAAQLEQLLFVRGVRPCEYDARAAGHDALLERLPARAFHRSHL